MVCFPTTADCTCWSAKAEAKTVSHWSIHSLFVDHNTGGEKADLVEVVEKDPKTGKSTEI
jgi:hypothetical protein